MLFRYTEEQERHDCWLDGTYGLQANKPRDKGVSANVKCHEANSKRQRQRALG